MQLKLLQAWLAKVERPLVIEIGAGTSVATVRHFSHQVVKSWGGRLIRINPTEAEVPTAQDVGLAGGALESLSVIKVLKLDGSPDYNSP